MKTSNFEKAQKVMNYINFCNEEIKHFKAWQRGGNARLIVHFDDRNENNTHLSFERSYDGCKPGLPKEIRADLDALAEKMQTFYEEQKKIFEQQLQEL